MHRVTLQLQLVEIPMPTTSSKANINRAENETKETGFTLDADGVIKPVNGLELKLSRLFFKSPMKFVIYESEDNSFDVRLRFDVSKGLFEAEIYEQNIKEVIHSETVPNCNSFKEASRAFVSFLERTKIGMRSVHSCATKCRETSASVITL